MFSDARIREVFHFCFLDRFLKLSNPGLYVLRGGANLRFFFNSPCYSEDMDIDVLAGSAGALKNNAYKILHDCAFRRSLRSFHIADIEIDKPARASQIDTTQRFRFGLVTSAGKRLPTKVEFSQRNDSHDGESEISLIDAGIARTYRTLAYRCPHYTGPTAVAQKLRALAGRPVPQARDVFDLAILIRAAHSPPAPRSKLLGRKGHAKALDSLMSLSWDDYEGQVVEFLHDDSRDEFGDRHAWERLRNRVLNELESHA
ncbi:MAG: nucleotidyl transferase AbiEii/AbiGii toxin family protein [Pseudomonadota bacterium]